jgi:hypothetical protein
MLKPRVWITLGCCIVATSISASAQSKKAGLWEVTSTTTIQQAGREAGQPSGTESVNPSPNQSAPLPVCLSQALIDKYGVVLPPSLRDCQVFNVAQTANHFTADMTCKGSYNGKGSIESTWTDEDHAVGKVHFVAKTKDASPISMRWTQDVSAVFKSADCGTIKPRPMPAK